MAGQGDAASADRNSDYGVKPVPSLRRLCGRFLRMNIFEILAEQRINEALLRGEFDDLPGAGKPLVFDDEPFVSPEQRMVNHILKNAGFAPHEILLRKEVATLRKEITALPPGPQRDALKRKLAFLLIQLCERP